MSAAVSGYLRGDRAHVENVVEALRRYAAEHNGVISTAGGTTSKQGGAVRFSTYFTVTLYGEDEAVAP